MLQSLGMDARTLVCSVDSTAIEQEAQLSQKPRDAVYYFIN